jgi:hypothetical protein
VIPHLLDVCCESQQDRIDSIPPSESPLILPLARAAIREVNTVRRAKLLELIASALHTEAGFDNQSTTTAAFYRRNGTLYLTHQHNKRYEELLRFAVSRLYSLSSRQMIRTPPSLSEALKKEIEGGNR